MNVFQLLAERVPGTWQLFAGTPSGDEVVEWAAGALEVGFDTPSLRIVASFGRPTSWFAVEKDFRASLRELGLASYPSEAEARRFRGAEIARRLLDGKTDVPTALDEFHRTVISPLHHPHDLQVWCYLSECRHPAGRRPISEEERNLRAFQAARSLLDQAGSAGA